MHKKKAQKAQKAQKANKPLSLRCFYTPKKYKKQDVFYTHKNYKNHEK